MQKNAFVALRFRNRLRYLAIDLCGVHRMFTPRLLAEGDDAGDFDAGASSDQRAPPGAGRALTSPGSVLVDQIEGFR
jgi:hypothetical protein